MASKQLSCLRVADDLMFDAVRVKKIEAAAWFVISMSKGSESGCDDACLSRVNIVNFDPNVVQRSTLGIGRHHLGPLRPDW